MTKKTISLIVAVDSNLAIGRGNDLPWRIPKDLQYFKKMTLGKPMIMGRKTFDSFGARPLPRRLNIVITRNKDNVTPQQGVAIVSSFKEALFVAKNESGEEMMVIGGGQVYTQALNQADRLYITHVDTVVEGADTFFPTYDEKEWHEVSAIKDNDDHYQWTWKIMEKK